MNYIVKKDGLEVQAPNLEDFLTLFNVVTNHDKTHLSQALANIATETAGLHEHGDSEEVQSIGVVDSESQSLSPAEWLSNAAAEARDKGPDATTWSFAGIWNKSLEEPEPRTTEARDHLWASDLGKPLADVWLKLKGVEPSNPPNPRSLRKFEAGNIWEWILALILKRAGILQSAQNRVTFQYENMLEVSGKIDFIAGGTPDVKAAFADLELPPSFRQGAERIIAHLTTRELGIKPLEIKSVSAFSFEGLERANKPIKNHRLQIYHYLKATGFPRGDIVYICRDDCRMIEFAVHLNDEALEREYKAYIEAISEYHFQDEMPPIDPAIYFDEDTGRFSKNNQVAWSPYLTKLYGFADQAEFDAKYQTTPARWNRVLSRVKAGKALTKKNAEAIEEIRKHGFDIDAIITKLTPEDDEATEE